MKKLLFLTIIAIATIVFTMKFLPTLRSDREISTGSGVSPVASAGSSLIGPLAPSESPPPMLSGQPVVKKYIHTNPVFSFYYPQALTLKTFGDENSETVLAHGQDSRREFQIYITPQDEDFIVTKERIMQDIPDMAVEQDTAISVGGVPGLSFLNRDSSGLVTREVWFVHDKFLYQISSYPDYTDQLGAILGTWKF